MGPVLFLLLFVAVTAFVALRRRGKDTRAADYRRAVLEALTPLVGGAVSRDLELTGTYRSYTITAELGLSSPAGLGSGPPGSGAKVMRLHITHPTLVTGQAWHFRRSAGLPQLGRPGWRFIEPGADFPFGRLLSRTAAIPMPDEGLEERLRAAGIEAALDRLPTDTAGWLPEVAYAGGIGQNLLARFQRAGQPVPPEAAEQAAQVGGLRIEVERPGDEDPRPERFQQLLDAAMDIIEVNRQANR